MKKDTEQIAAALADRDAADAAFQAARKALRRTSDPAGVTRLRAERKAARAGFEAASERLARLRRGQQ